MLLIAIAAWSVVGTVVIPRGVRSRLVVGVDKVIGAGFAGIYGRLGRFEARDRVAAVHAPLVLVAQVVVWLAMYEVGFALLLWSLGHLSFGEALVEAGSSVGQLGNVAPRGGVAAALDDLCSLFALVTIALQIAYLPTLYAAFNRRETDVTLLDARAGLPSWGPELLARTHYGLGSHVSALDSLPDLFRGWERWAADVAESHTTYLPLVRFRSPRALSSWVTALLAVLDAAALYLTLGSDPAEPVAARLCLRAGFSCFTVVARALGQDVEEDPDPAEGIQLSYQEFLEALERLRRVEFPITREPRDSWTDFVGWRVNYERAAYRIAYLVDAPPALWSGPRRHPSPPLTPLRPVVRGLPPRRST